MIIIASYSNVSVTYTANGSQTVFSFPFDYLRKAFVYVKTDGNNVLTQGEDYDVSEKTVVFATAPASGTVIKIYRQTDTTPLVSWADASVLRAKDMTVQQTQELHILEEQGYWLETNTIYQTNGNWDAQGLQFKNVGEPTDDDDAATKEYVDDTYEYVRGKIDSLDDAVDDAEDAADRAEEALELIKERAAWFDNVAAMRADETLEAGMTAGTKGYYAINDGGNAVYNIREKTDADTQDKDGGFIILLDNGLVAELIVFGVYNIRQLGCKGDGVTDDTVAFKRAVVSGMKTYVPKGTFLIDFTNLNLVNTNISGASRKYSVIKQRNANVPFGRIRENAVVENLTFVTTNNTEPTDVLTFGYAVNSALPQNPPAYRSFENCNIEKLNFTCDDYTIPLHFNIQFGGSAGGYVHDILINGCYKGVWFEYVPNVYSGLQWLTQFKMKDVYITSPVVYGFEWDSLSPNQGSGVSSMWSYANYFENISVELTKHNSTGFYLGHGMSWLINPIVFNDINPPDDATDPESYIGYAIEFAPVNNPQQYKMITRIVGGSVEGRIKNANYRHMCDIKNLNLSARNNFDSTNNFVIYDTAKTPEIYPIDIFDRSFLEKHCYFGTNTKYEYGSDVSGRYLKVSRINSNAYITFAIQLSAAEKEAINHRGLSTVLFACEISTGGDLGSIDRLEYGTTICGKDHDQWKMNDTVYTKGYYHDFPSSGQSFSNNNIVMFATGSGSASVEWIKIYDVKWLDGIVGLHYIQERIKSNDIILRNPDGIYDLNYSLSGLNKVKFIYADLTAPDTDKSIRVECCFRDKRDANCQPISIHIHGSLPACTAGSSISYGTIPNFVSMRTGIYILAIGSTGNTVGYFNISSSGALTYTCKTAHGALTVLTATY